MLAGEPQTQSIAVLMGLLEEIFGKKIGLKWSEHRAKIGLGAYGGHADVSAA